VVGLQNLFRSDAMVVEKPISNDSLRVPTTRGGNARRGPLTQVRQHLAETIVQTSIPKIGGTHFFFCPGNQHGATPLTTETKSISEPLSCLNALFLPISFARCVEQPAAAGTFSNVQLTVQDATGASSTGTYTVTINVTPTLGTLSLTQWTVNQSGYSGTIAITGGTSVFGNLTVTGLPTGLTAALSGGTITVGGTPTAAGSFNNINVSATDAA